MKGLETAGPSALKMLQAMWASLLRIQITGTDSEDHQEEQHDIKMLQCHCKISVTPAGGLPRVRLSFHQTIPGPNNCVPPEPSRTGP